MSNPVIVEDRVQEKREQFYEKIGLNGSKGSLPEDKSLARKQFKKQSKENELTHEKEVIAAKLAVIYYDRLLRSKQVLARIERFCPPAEKLAQSFRDAHEAAEKKVAEGKTPASIDWGEATKILHRVSVSDAEEKARELWNSAAEKLKKEHPEIHKLNKEIRELLQDTRVLMLEEKNRFWATMTQNTKPALVPNPGKKELMQAALNLTELKTSLDKAIQQAEKKQKQARLLRLEADNLFDIIAPQKPKKGELPLLTDLEAAGLRRLSSSADTAEATCDYDTELLILQQLVNEAKSLVSTREPLRKKWLEHAGKLPKRLKAARELFAATSPEVQEEAAALVRRLEEISTLGPGTGIPFEKAIERLNSAPTEIGNLKEQETSFVEFAKERLEAEGRIAVLVRDVELAFAELHSAVYDVTDGAASDIADGSFRGQLTQIMKDWNGRVTVAFDVGSLDEAGATTKLNELRKSISVAAKNPSQLAGLIEGGKLEEAREQYVVARDAAVNAAEQLTELNGSEGGSILMKIESLETQTLKATSPGDYDGPKSLMQILETQALEAASREKEKVLLLQDRLKQLLKPIPDELQQLMDLTNKLKSSEKQAPHLAMHATLQTSLDSLRAMLSLRQVPLLESSIDEAETLQKEMTAALRAADGKKNTDGTDPITFEDIRRELNELKRTLADEDIQIYAKVTAFGLEESIKTLEKELGSTTISALTDSLGKLTVSVDDCRKQAAKDKSQFKGFEKELDKVTKKLEDAAFKDSPAYVKAVKGRIASILADARFEGGRVEAQKKAASLYNELFDVLDGPLDKRGVPQALVDKEDAAVASARKAEIEKSKFEGEVKVLEKQLKSLKHLNSQEIGSLEQTLSESKKAAQKSGDFSTGREQLQAVRTRLALVSENPNGLAITVRKRLPSVLTRVKRAITEMHKALKSVEDSVMKLDDLDEAGKTAVKKQLAQVRGLFNPVAFDKSVATVAKEGLDDESRSAARETALREIRKMMAYVYEDYRLQVLAETPESIRPKMAAVISELNLAFLDLENNLLISM